MKKIMLFAAACIALAACSKEIDTTTPEIGDGTAFEKGQTVTLTVKTGDQTKVSSELVTSGTDKDKVNFKWETGDKIKVTVGTESAEFTLSSGAGDATAEFTGAMPEGGESFDVQYPVTDPDLSSQTYVANGLPKDKMKFTASGCTLDNSFTLTHQNAALRLNLYADVTIGKIVVTDKTASPEVSYTLTCIDGVKNNTGNETMPFFIVIPAGSRNFEAKVYGTGETPALICTRTTTSAKTFENGKVLNMPLKYDYPRTDMDKITIGTTVWAPVNCGYDATNYPMGLLYQWGRKYGQAYEANTINPTTMGKSDDTEVNKDKFGEYNTTNYNWFSGTVDNNLWNGGTKGKKDPCPEGWRVPTSTELQALITTKVWTTTGGPSGNQTGYLFGTAPNQVFLPAAGYRGYKGSANNRGNNGDYWSSSVNVPNAWGLDFYSGYAGMDGNYYRADGFSVRCVQE